MDLGLMMIFSSYGWEGISDDQVWDEDIRLARQAPGLGFDVLWSAEHHFFDYSFCPDNLQLMTYLAGVCPDIDLGTAAVIVPWHDPLRVAEQAAMLDYLSKGRLRLGLGRGLARREFSAFRGTMDERRCGPVGCRAMARTIRSPASRSVHARRAALPAACTPSRRARIPSTPPPSSARTW